MRHSLSENHRLRRLYLLPRARLEKLSPHAAALLQMISSKTSRPASRRSVPLASDLGLTPMTLGLLDLHLERPAPRAGISPVLRHKRPSDGLCRPRWRRCSVS